MATTDWKHFDELRYRRRLETFGIDDGPVVASGPKGEFDGVCQPGELTDKGRETTLALGHRLRHLYVDQLKFMPKMIADSDMIYLRATPLSRALESVQQAFWGMYPPSARTADFPPPTILTRTPADETLYPNDGSCRRFAHLTRAFAERTAGRWNDTDDMKYLSKMLQKYMPDQQKVAVDSKPRLSGIMDTLNATLAHGPETRLPKEFYDPKVRAIIDKIGVEEWYSGYQESQEYRALGIGSLAGDIVSRMVGSVEQNGNDGLVEIGGEDGNLGRGRGGERGIRLALSGCHDTTLAGLLTSLGAFEGEKWPPYTSHVAIELFRERQQQPMGASTVPPRTRTSDDELKTAKQEHSQSWWRSLFGSSRVAGSNEDIPPSPEGIARKRISELTDGQRKALDGYFVRIRYNDRVMQIPGCAPPGKHWDGDQSFCTLVCKHYDTTSRLLD
jgi:acid phosphatase